jgi:cytoskeletal protein RodZ
VETVVADIGADLRQARIEKKRTIEDIAAATKINPTVLRAIENDAFSRVPGGLFTRGFLRAFAREVGLDPEDIVQRYRAEYEPAPTAETPESPPVSEPERLGHVRFSSVELDAEAAAARRTQLLQLSIVLLIVLLYFATWRRPKPQANDAKEVAPAAETSDRETAVATSGRENAAPATAAPSAPQGPLTLEVQTTGPCWIEATADGKRILGRLMDEGNTQSIPLTGDLTLRVGDPQTFAFTIGGAKGKALGQPAKPVTVHITPENYKTFLESKS